MTYGRAVQKALKMFGIDITWQPTVTGRRSDWHQALKHDNFKGNPKKSR